MSDNFADPSDDELTAQIVRLAFELNLLLRVCSLRGVDVNVDLVDRKNEAHPDGYTEIRFRAGVHQWPT